MKPGHDENRTVQTDRQQAHRHKSHGKAFPAPAPQFAAAPPEAALIVSLAAAAS